MKKSDAWWTIVTGACVALVATPLWFFANRDILLSILCYTAWICGGVITVIGLVLLHHQDGGSNNG